ncbi:MAG: tetratricopeptide repeat protein, partial [Candidatus Thermoplasmatota archaeon]
MEGLDRESSEKLLASRKEKVKKERLAEIHETIKGHPLALQLIDVKNGLVTRDVKNYLRKEIYLELTREEKNLAEIASVFRKQIEAKALLIEDVNYDTLDDLVKRSLITRVSQDRYEMHDLLKEFFYSTLTPELAKKYHLAAGNYYEKSGEITALLEAAYHFLSAGSHKKVAEIATQHGEKTINEGYGKEFKKILTDLNKESVPQNSLPRLYILEGTVNYLIGQWEKALECYTVATNLSKEDESKAEAYLKIGHLHRKTEKWNAAITNYKKSLDILKRIENKHLSAEVYRGLGYVYWRNGEFDKALEHYRKAMKKSKEINDLHEIGIANIELGNVYNEKGYWDNALSYYNKSLELLEKIDLPESARVYNNIGDLYLKKEEYDKAIEYFEKCKEISEKIGFVVMKGWALFNAGECYAKKIELEKAKEYCDEALEILRCVKDDLGISALYRNYGIIYRHKKDWGEATKYFKKCADFLDKIKMPYDLAYTYFEFAQMYKDKGDREKAKEYL